MEKENQNDFDFFSYKPKINNSEDNFPFFKISLSLVLITLSLFTGVIYYGKQKLPENKITTVTNGGFVTINSQALQDISLQIALNKVLTEKLKEQQEKKTSKASLENDDKYMKKLQKQ